MNKPKTVVTGVAALAAVALIGACGNSGTKEAATTSVTTSTSTSVESSAQAAPHNRSDMMFTHMMIPHHEQAIEMSDILLSKKDIDPRVVDLAKQIKAAQGPEIAQMQGWLEQWNMRMEDMPPMMSDAEMDALKNAQGVEATKLYLTGMIKHHQGAITMGQDEIKDGEFPDAIAMAKSIVESQQKEIDTMNQILSSL